MSLRNSVKRWCWSLALPAGLLALGCQVEKEAGIGPEHGGSLETGGALPADDGWIFEAPLSIGNIKVWPIIAQRIKEIGEFLTLSQAQDQGVAVVSEVGTGAARPQDPEVPVAAEPRLEGPSASRAEGGAPGVEVTEELVQSAESPGIVPISSGAPAASVNTVLIENKSDVPIFVCGGTIVKGGNQDRQIGQDFVIAPRSKVPVDAFCVEHGRWTESREGAPTRGFFQCLASIAPSSIRYSGVYARAQDAVWEQVALTNAASAKAPGTGTLLATLEETDREAATRRDELGKAVREHFRALRGKGKAPVGFAYAVNGKPVTVRTFAHPRLFESQFDSFVTSMCVEADLAGRKGKDPSPPAELGDMLELVKAINQEAEEVSPTPAANRNGLRRSARGGNSNCYYELPAPAAGSSSPGAKVVIPLSRDWTSADGWR